MEQTQAYIKHENGKWVIYSEKGKKLGTYNTKQEAIKRLKSIEYWKHQKSSLQENADMKFTPDPVNKPANGPTKSGDYKKYDVKLPVSLKTKSGSIADIPNDQVVDGGSHFTILTEDQAKSAVNRVVYSLREAPDWFNGSLDELKETVISAVAAKYPKLQIKATVSVEDIFEAIAKKKKKKMFTPYQSKKSRSVLLQELTGSVTYATFTEVQQVFAEGLLERLSETKDAVVSHYDDAIKLCKKCVKNGLSADEFNSLISYVQESVVNELMYQSKVKKSESSILRLVVENRRNA